MPDRTREYRKVVANWARIRLQINKRQFGIGTIPRSIKLGAAIYFYFPDNRIRDLDNCEKSILDGGQHILYENDNQITAVFKKRMPNDKINPRAEVHIFSEPEDFIIVRSPIG